MTEREYASKIRQLLMFQGIRVGEAEQEAGLHVGYLSRIIKGNGRLSLDTANKLAQTTGYTMIDVLTKDIVGDYEREKIQKELNILRKREQELEARLSGGTYNE